MNNQATNFREAVQENLQQIFLGQDHFEEVVTWYDTDTAEGRSVTICDVTEHGNLEVDTHHRKTGRCAHFLVTNDPVLGTTKPATGMSLQRADNSWWGFKRVMTADFAAFVLEFVGGQLDRYGHGRAGHL